VRVPELIYFVDIQDSGHATEHLQYERLSVHQIELFDRVLDGSGHQFVGLMTRIDLQECRHDEEVPGN